VIQSKNVRRTLLPSAAAVSAGLDVAVDPSGAVEHGGVHHPYFFRRAQAGEQARTASLVIFGLRCRYAGQL